MSRSVTPDNATVLKPESTPHTCRSDVDDGKQTEARPQIMIEMDKEFVLCGIEDFMRSYLTFGPTDAQLEACFGSMNSSTINRAGDNLRFSNYPEIPSSKDGTETQVYSRLSDIAKAVGNYRGSQRRNDFIYRDCPNQSLTSDIHVPNNKIDACFTSYNGKGKIPTSSIAVPMEFKLKPRDRCQNNIQLVSANVQIMNDDPRRMFTFGITVEADQVSLWYHCRSHSAISKQFNFVKNPRLLIKVFMSFLFATPEQLGYDSLVTRHIDPKDRASYTYELPQDDKSLFYRTKKILSEYRSNTIAGRMPRVWLVRQVDSNEDDAKELGDTEYVLKDVWLDEGSDNEKEIQQKIFTDIKAFWKKQPTDAKLVPLWKKHAGIVQNDKFQKYFLEIAFDHSGQASPSPAPSTPMRGLFTSTPTGTAKSGSTRRSEGPNIRPVPELQATSVINRSYLPKRQYRLIFPEVCTTVGHLKTLGEAVDVLSQTLIPLQLLLCAGWVHRDISSGNIMAYKSVNGWHVKLADLEYAKKYPNSPGYEPVSDPKAGTPYFMAHEILSEKYLYQPGIETLVALKPFRGEAQAATPVTTPVIHKPIHHFLHDLESLWWLLLWTITRRIAHELSQEFSRPIFQNGLTLSEARSNCFINAIEAELKAVLEPRVQSFASPMNTFRQNIAFTCRDLVKNISFSDKASFTTIHANVVDFFDVLDDTKSEWFEISLVGNNRDINAQPDEGNENNNAEPARLKQRKRALGDDANHSPVGSRAGSKGSNSKRRK